MLPRVFTRRRALALALAWPFAAVASGLPDGAGAPVMITPREVTDDGHLVLADGTILILAGLAPGDAALRDALTARLDRSFTRGADAAPDRYRRIRAQVASAGAWLQAELVAAGLAQAGVDPAARRHLRDLTRLENEARQARRGGWGDGRFRVLDAGALGFVATGFHVLEGRVERVANERAASIVTFATATRRPLRVNVPAALRAELRRAGISVDGWAGRRLQVRGHVAWRGGLMIEAIIPEQFEMEP